ncbi:MAG: tetratricopeptide repeat protein [Flavobacteriaceae bacterium]|nr:tetratricopeptide repeat protein [Flavobacteriaceae bacterium]
MKLGFRLGISRAACMAVSVLCGLGIVVFSLSECAKNTEPETVSTFLNLNDSARYVGIDACKGCHADKHETFVHTGMGQSFHLAEKKYSKANFVNARPIYDAKNNLYYYPFLRKNKLYIQEFRLTRPRTSLQIADTIHNRVEQITHIIGSGHHTNSHFWTDGGHLFQAPLTFYTQKGIWDLPPGYEVTNTRFNRKIDIECMGCHTGMSQVKEGSVNMFTQLPLGIDCERCHGPGSLHVAEKQAGIVIDTRTKTDWTIVNPKRLPWKLQVDICQRCHLQGNNILKEGKKFTDFKPGMHLDSIFEIYMPKVQGDAPFVMAGHAERFQMSACFKKSNTGDLNQYNPNINFTCINCHNPHLGVTQTNQDKFNETCTGCHHTKSKQSHFENCLLSTKQRLGKTCVQCHMPASDTKDIPHVTVHDHYIRRPWTGVLKSKENLEDYPKRIAKNAPISAGLYCVNSKNPSPVQLFKAYVTWFEKFESLPIYKDKADALFSQANEIPLVQLQHLYNQQNYQAVVSLIQGIDLSRIALDAWSAYRIGKSEDKMGNLSSALPWYTRANEAMPFNSDFAMEKANAQIRNKNLDAAYSCLTELLAHQPKHELANLNLGVCHYLKGHFALAKKQFEKTLLLNPDSENACLYLAELYLKLSNTFGAKQYLKRAIAINPKNLDAQTLLKGLSLPMGQKM